MMDSRYANEFEFLAQIVYEPNLLTITKIKPKYLSDKNLKKMMEDLIFIYDKFEDVNTGTINQAHSLYKKEIDLVLYLDLFKNKMYTIAQDKAIKQIELDIVEQYKNDVLKDLNKKVVSGEIPLQTFTDKASKLNEIKLYEDVQPVTIDEIKENIKDQKMIHFNKFEKLEKILKLAQNDLLVIGSPTGTGKTGFLLNLMNDLMGEYQCVYFNMEMSKSSIYKRMIAINADMPVYHIENPNNYQQKLISEAIDNIDKSKVIVEHKLNKINEIKSMIRQVKDKSKHTIIFLDHLGLLRIDGKNNLYEQMTEIMKQLRQICLDYDCTIVGASQLNRSSYTSEELSVSMLKDSGELENSARKIILLYRDPKEDKTNLEPNMFVDVQKNDSGATGIIQMKYYKTKQVFKEV